jgi:hypothetical protein
MDQQLEGERTKKRPRGTPFKPGQVANPLGRKPGTKNKFSRQLKEAILDAAASVGMDGKGKEGLEGFLIAQARKADNRGFMMLLGKVLPMTVAFDKNRPLQVQTTIELVRPEGDDAPRDVTPRRVLAPVIDHDAVPPAPAMPVRVKPPRRSGT